MVADRYGNPLPERLERRTVHTLVEPSALLRELAGIHRTGTATELQECALGRTCTANSCRSAR